MFIYIFLCLGVLLYMPAFEDEDEEWRSFMYDLCPFIIFCLLAIEVTLNLGKQPLIGYIAFKLFSIISWLSVHTVVHLILFVNMFYYFRVCMVRDYTEYFGTLTNRLLFIFQRNRLASFSLDTLIALIHTYMYVYVYT